MPPHRLIDDYHAVLFRFAIVLTRDAGAAYALAREAFAEWLEMQGADDAGPENAHLSLLRFAFVRAADSAARSEAADAAWFSPSTERRESDRLLASISTAPLLERAALALFVDAGCSARQVAAVLRRPLAEVVALIAEAKVRGVAQPNVDRSEATPLTGMAIYA